MRIRLPGRYAGLPVLAMLYAAPGYAQSAPTAGDDLNDIVVTAEKTDRTLRNTASSVVVRTQDDVDRLAGAYSTDDILARIPNLVTDRPGNDAPAIRGIDGTGPAVGANAFFAGTRSRINFLLDGRQLTFNEIVYLDGLLWDIQQIEVYRGPQSTLQGRNAIGGVVAVKTADPTFDWHGKVRGVAGGNDTYQLSGAIGGPIIPDVFAFRVAADYRSEDFFVDFAPYTARKDGVSTATRMIDNPSHQRSVAVRGKLLFTPTPDIRALLTYSHSDAYAPQTGDVTRPFEDHGAAFLSQPRFQTRADVGIADTSWQVSDKIRLSAFLTATDFRVNRYARLDDGNARIDGREYTAEPRIRFGAAGDRLTGFLAGYLFHARQDEQIDLFNGGFFHDATDTRAVFGELTYKITPKIDLTLGTRYEAEERDRTGGAGVFAIDFHKTFHAFLPRGTLTVQASDAVTVGATIGRGYNAGGAGFAFDPPFPSFVYDKETVTNYEGFVRGALLDNRLRLSANVFYNDYRGLQLPFDVNPDPAINSIVIRNADRATTYGAEVEAHLQALRTLEFFANAGVLKTKVDRYDDPTVQGNDLPRSPAFTLNTGFVGTPMPGLDLSFDIRFTDAYYSDAFNDARGKTRPYTIANAQASYRIGPARLFVAATNLFDTTDVQQLSPGATRADDIAVISRPRKVTGGIELSF